MFNSIRNSFKNGSIKFDLEFDLEFFNLIEYYKDEDTFMIRYINRVNNNLFILIFIHMDLLNFNISKTNFDYSLNLRLNKKNINLMNKKVDLINLEGNNLDEKMKYLIDNIISDCKIFLDTQRLT